MNKAIQFKPESTQAERALQAYLILIGVAHNHQTITYVDLSTLMHGHAAPTTVNTALGRIVMFCRKYELPRLPVLVVNKLTGRPGETHVYDDLESLDAERQRVFEYEWYKLQPPSLDELTG